MDSANGSSDEKLYDYLKAINTSLKSIAWTVALIAGFLLAFLLKLK